MNITKVIFFLEAVENIECFLKLTKEYKEYNL